MSDIYYIDNIAKLKEQINNIRTHAPNTKPVYNIHNPFTPAFLISFVKKYGISHYACDIKKYVS